jgi:hypothetical protein
MLTHLSNMNVGSRADNIDLDINSTLVAKPTEKPSVL